MKARGHSFHSCLSCPFSSTQSSLFWFVGLFVVVVIVASPDVEEEPSAVSSCALSGTKAGNNAACCCFLRSLRCLFVSLGGLIFLPNTAALGQSSLSSSMLSAETEQPDTVAFCNCLQYCPMQRKHSSSSWTHPEILTRAIV